MYFIYFQSDKARNVEIKNESIQKLLNANKVHWIKLVLENHCVCMSDVLAARNIEQGVEFLQQKLRLLHCRQKWERLTAKRDAKAVYNFSI